MTTRICCLGSAALGVALLSACGSTNPVSLDTSVLSTGENNQVSSGGYIWTYTDHNETKTDAVAADPTTWDYHATISPRTDPETRFAVTSEEGEHGKVLKVTGDVPLEIPWTLVSEQDPASVDKYWPTHYPDAMIPAYPAAGMGFGFLPGNEVYDATQGGKYIGITFDMKANTNMEVVWVSIPTSGTDVPDPGNEDKFTKTCTHYTDENDPLTGGSSCFTNFRKGIFSATSIAGAGNTYNTMAATGQGQKYCVLYSEVAIPNWANAKTRELTQAVGFDPTKAVKVQWDMFQPKQGDYPTRAAFDVSIDNIKLITEEEAKDAANNCDPGRIDNAYGTGDAG